MINYDHNSRQGTMLNNFKNLWGLTPGPPPVDNWATVNSQGGTPFLHVPLPDAPFVTPVPTMGICNGHGGS